MDPLRVRPRMAGIGAALIAIGLASGVLGCGDEGTPDPASMPELAAPPPSIPAGDPPARTPEPPEDEPSSKPAGAEDVAAGMGTPQLASQRVVYSFDGPSAPQLVLDRIAEGRAAGVLLFSRNVESDGQVRKLTGELRRAALRGPLGLQPLILVDQEGGAIRRLPGPPGASAEQLGELDDAAIAAAGSRTGAYLRGLGINVDLAPVADVGYRGGVIAEQDRAFASSPTGAASAAVAFASGLQDAGVAATAKHFPGLGRAEVTTDDASTSIAISETELGADLIPFRAAIGAGTRLVMLGTAVYPGLSGRPAALARPIATGLLRDRLRFGGVSITDALDTPALAPFGGPGEAAVEAVRAGSDLVIFGLGPEASVEADRALRSAARGGELSRPALLESAIRILTLREDLPD